MKYLILITAAVTLSACSKSKKDITVYGRIVDSSNHPDGNHALWATGGRFNFISAAIMYADFTTDSAGYFQFKISPRLLGDSIVIANKEGNRPRVTNAIRIVPGYTLINAGTLIMHLPPRHY